MPSFEEYKSRVDAEIAAHDVVLYMRGEPDFPRCGFSARAVEVFRVLKQPFHAVDLDEDRGLWQALAKINDWPTAPQIFVHGEFIGGCDNTIEAYQTGELQKRLAAGRKG